MKPRLCPYGLSRRHKWRTFHEILTAEMWAYNKTPQPTHRHCTKCERIETWQWVPEFNSNCWVLAKLGI